MDRISIFFMMIFDEFLIPTCIQIAANRLSPSPPAPESVKKSPPGSGGELKAVRPPGDGRPWRFSSILGLHATLPPPMPLRASTPPKIGGDFFIEPLSLGERVAEGQVRGTLDLETESISFWQLAIKASTSLRDPSRIYSVLFIVLLLFFSLVHDPLKEVFPGRRFFFGGFLTRRFFRSSQFLWRLLSACVLCWLFRFENVLQ